MPEHTVEPLLRPPRTDWTPHERDAPTGLYTPTATIRSSWGGGEAQHMDGWQARWTLDGPPTHLDRPLHTTTLFYLLRIYRADVYRMRLTR